MTDATRTATATAPRRLNAISVDVEDYFQVQAFAGSISRGDWDDFPCRVEANTERLLELFAEKGVHGTFFTLGWVARRYPDLVRRIVAGGHELASHGEEHRQVYTQSPAEFRKDIRDSKAILEDQGGVAVKGFRAASFSITGDTLWVYEVLAEEGYAYSSSIYPIRHDLYGIPDAPRFCFEPVPGAGVPELPITTARLLGRNWPCGGGGYFRLLPYLWSRWAIARVNRIDRQPAVFYFHPWEVDPEQPRQSGAPLKSKFRHYTNLGKMQNKLSRLMDEFSWGRVDDLVTDNNTNENEEENKRIANTGT